MQCKATLSLLALSLPLLAQAPPLPPGARQPRFDEIKNYLTLADAQMQQLQQITRMEAEANRSRAEEIGQKQKTLQEQLRAGSTDAAALGRLLVEIENLRRQADTASKSFHDQALNVLNAAQKTKLKTLEDASKLQSSIVQAVGLNLLERPAPGDGPLSPPLPPIGLRFRGPAFLERR
ncbi:MAG: Spy/CpxP family protein refolding chaperone [Acidobacteria bacterium]|nr:Spy/CpxP family protein refolding chaperone [Acidobacteriota bacterium]